ncbi:hypothetical protein [Streptomyces sp. NPDC050355]|uniref:hypothetical protein n=1 Tax=Streptomyces sp. NPDC050355 TaxID=3365609 RepID=UPI0037A2D16D
MGDAIALDGFLDEEAVPGDLNGSTARFQLTVSPTDERTDDMILPCSVADPVLAHAVLSDLQPGDQLRVTNCLRLPAAAAHTGRADVAVRRSARSPRQHLTPDGPSRRGYGRR